MLNDSEKLLAVCLDNSINYIAKNLMLIKKESLIRKIGIDLAATQISTHLFIKKIQIKKYKHLGETTILESKTSSAKVKSILEKFAYIIQKKLSRIIYLNMSINSLKTPYLACQVIYKDYLNSISFLL